MGINIKNVGVWIRVSTEEQAQGESPKHHEIRARSYADAKGWQVLEVYDLAGVSGKSVIEHPECKRMLADIKRGHITTLIFSKLARLARNTKELLEFSDYFQKNNADLVSLAESIDTATPAGRLFYTIIAAMAEWERAEITDRIKASVAVRAKLGKPLTGRAPFGYRIHDGKICPHPDEAPVRKLMYELFAEHKRLKRVARILTERGYRSRQNNCFSDIVVERMIRDTTAIGEYRSNFSYQRSDKRGFALKPEHEWVITPVEPIVQKGLWERCNILLDERKTKRKVPGPKVVHLFTGYVFCSCGKKMYVPSNSPKYICGTCRSKISMTDLEQTFYADLQQIMLAPEKVAEYLNRASDTLQERSQLLNTLRRERDKLKEETELLFQLHRERSLTPDQFKVRFQPLDTLIQKIAEEIPRIEAQIDVLKIDGLSKEHILKEGSSFYERWPKMSQDERRNVVESLLDRVVVSEDELTMNYVYVPSSELLSERQRNVKAMSSMAGPPSPLPLVPR